MSKYPSPIRHIAAIMDGNRRWALSHSLSTASGHFQGSKNVKVFLESCLGLEIEYVSLFAFSKENWGRSSEEVKYLWMLIHQEFQNSEKFLHQEKIKFIAIGDRNHWPVETLKLINELEIKTRTYSRLNFIMVLDYSGQWEIDHAIEQAIINGRPSNWKEYLLTAQFPPPDILIRTGCEQRISNFYLYSLAYTELFFPNILWPDFKKEDLISIINQYRQRTRRFGLDYLK